MYGTYFVSGAALSASQMLSHFVLTTNLYTRPWGRVLSSVHAWGCGAVSPITAPSMTVRCGPASALGWGTWQQRPWCQKCRFLTCPGYWIRIFSLQWFLRMAKLKTTDPAHLFIFREMTWRVSLPLLANCSTSATCFVLRYLFPSLVNVHFSGGGTENGWNQPVNQGTSKQDMVHADGRGCWCLGWGRYRGEAANYKILFPPQRAPSPRAEKR